MLSTRTGSIVAAAVVIAAATFFTGAVAYGHHRPGHGGGGGGGGGGNGGGGEPPGTTQEIVYIDTSSNRRAIRIMDPDGSNKATVLAAPHPHDSMFHPTWSPDGQQILFFGGISNQRGWYVVNIDGSELTRIVATDWADPADWSPSPAPDGEHKITYTDRVQVGTEVIAHAFVANPDGTGTMMLPNPPDGWRVVPGSVAWTPDGRLTLVRGALFGNDWKTEMVLIELVDDNGTVVFGNETTLLEFDSTQEPPGLQVGSLRWANHSDWIAATIYDGIEWSLSHVDLTDPASPQVSTIIPERWPAVASFSPDDERVVTFNNASEGIFTINIDGTDPTVIATGAAHPNWRRPAPESLPLTGPDSTGCFADFNGDGVVDVNDVLAYLRAFEAGDSRADLTDDGVLTAGDLQVFLEAFGAGCD